MLMLVFDKKEKEEEEKEENGQEEYLSQAIWPSNLCTSGTIYPHVSYTKRDQSC